MSGLRLGVSSNILPYTQEEIINADYRFNKFFLSTFGGAVNGFITGALLSLFFLRKPRIIFYGAGFGGGLSFFSELSK